MTEQDSPTAAWIDFADNGNIRFWTSDPARAANEKMLGRHLLAFTLAELIALVSNTRTNVPTCCVTGAIAGDGGACGDCDPCILGEAHVPQPVKALIAEKASLALRLGEAVDELETMKADLLNDVVVHINMVRGTIAKPSWENLRHLYPRIYDLEHEARRAGAL